MIMQLTGKSVVSHPIQAMITGSIPGFLDIATNLDSPALVSDNLVCRSGRGRGVRTLLLLSAESTIGPCVCAAKPLALYMLVREQSLLSVNRGVLLSIASRVVTALYTDFEV